MFAEVPPWLVMIVGGLVLPVLPRRVRPTAFLVVSLLALVVVCFLPEGTQWSVEFVNLNLILCKVDRLSRVFGIVFSIIAFAGGVYSFHVKETGHQVAALLYAGGSLGITFAGDLVTLLIFWELIAIVSAYLVWSRRTREAERAGMRYLLVHLFGGSVLLAGVLVHVTAIGAAEIAPMAGNETPGYWLILFGVVLNAAVPPLHAWLADAYPKATVTGAVFLSAFTTKSAVYVLARLFPGEEVLVFFGVMMALYGVVYAVLANDIREILAYHIISQVGYMVAGVGIGTEMALNGTTAHAFSHILYKALLFMGAGVVLETTGKSKLTELGGLAKAMPVTLMLYMVGAFSISGFPLFNGFISKSMVVAAAGESGYSTAYLLLLLASVGTFLHTGLKLPYFTWFAESRGLVPSRPPLNMHIGMSIVAILCIMFGITPRLLYDLLPFPTEYQPYTLHHLTETTQILTFTFIAFWLLRRQLAGEPTIALDTDWFYRRPAPLLWRSFVVRVGAFFDWTESIAIAAVGSAVRLTRNPLQAFNARASESVDRADFDPDFYRRPMENLIVLVLLGVVVLSVVGLIWILT